MRNFPINSLWIAGLEVLAFESNVMGFVGSRTQRGDAALFGAVLASHNHRHHRQSLGVQMKLIEKKFGMKTGRVLAIGKTNPSQ